MRNLLAASLLLAAATAASGAELTETIDRTFDVKPGATVTLSNVNGRVSVTSWDQPRVRVIARKEVKGDRDDLKEAMKALRVELLPREGGLLVRTHHPRHDHIAEIFDFLSGDRVQAQVRYDLMVPRNMNVDVTNTNGAIQAQGLGGKLELGTTNGAIKVAACSGSLNASTTNGAISAELLQVAKGQPLSFETTNGRIEVALPANLALNVDADTTNGAIRSDLPVATTRTSRNSLRGTINGGGTPLRMRTTNGGISIRTLSR